MTPFVPLFLQLLPCVEDELIVKYFAAFARLFSSACLDGASPLDINATTNLNQLLNLPFWYDYLFVFVCRVRDEHPSILDAVWSESQALLLSVVVSTMEKNLYKTVANASDVQKDEETVRLMRLIFGAIKRYLGLNDFKQDAVSSFSKGLFADFYILVVNRIISMLGMPGNRVGVAAASDD